MDAQLRKNVLDMMPHRVRAQVELFGNLPIRRPPREQTRDLRFTPRQPESREALLRREFAVVRALLALVTEAEDVAAPRGSYSRC